MNDVIDFEQRRKALDLRRRKLSEPPAAVVLVTQSGKIAAWATGDCGSEDIIFGDEEEMSWRPFSVAQELAEKLRSHPAATVMELAGFRIEAVRI